MASGQLGGIAKAPVMLLACPGEDRAFFGAGLITDRYYMVKPPALSEQTEDTPGFLHGNINSDLLHHLDNEGIQGSRLQSRALSLETVSPERVRPKT